MPQGVDWRPQEFELCVEHNDTSSWAKGFTLCPAAASAVSDPVPPAHPRRLKKALSSFCATRFYFILFFFLRRYSSFNWDDDAQ